MNRGVPPTDWKARTGEFTPPGVTALARSNNWTEVPTRETPVLTGLAYGPAFGPRSARAGLAAGSRSFPPRTTRPAPLSGWSPLGAGAMLGVLRGGNDR